MSVKSPAMTFFKAFGLGLGDVVQNGCPAQPKVVAFQRQVVKNLQGMVEIVFMTKPFTNFHSLQKAKFRKDALKQSGFVKQLKADRRLFCQDYFIQLITDTLHTYDL